MASVGINVMRYTALAGGLFYGISHNQALKSAGRAAQEKHEYEAQENKISEAKRAWEERQKPASSVISDPENPQFDLEKWINHAAGQAGQKA